jgi:hypothetical protein
VRRRRHRWFEIVAPDGLTLRICGDPGMDRETLEALIALGKAMQTMGEEAEMTTTDPITAELIVTLPDEAALIAATFAAAAVAPDAALFRSSAAPWQLKASAGRTDAATWRGRLVSLVEVLLPGAGATPLAAHLDTLGDLAERCANLHAAASLPLRPELHLEALTPALREMSAQLRQIYVAVAGEDPWEDAPDEA